MRPFILRLRGNAAGEAQTNHTRNTARFGNKLLRVRFNGRKYATHDTARAQVPDQSSRVDLRDDRDTVFFEVRTSQFVRTPVAGGGGELADHQPLDIRLHGFVVFDVGSV